MDQIPSIVEQYTERPLSIVHHSLRASRRRVVVGLVAHRAFSHEELQLRSAHFEESNEGAVVTVRQLAKEITAIEQNISIKHATGDKYHNTYTTLIQTHLPELDDVGAIAYDADRKEVAPAENLAILSMVAATTSPIVQALFHHAVAGTYNRETTSLQDSSGD